jgi:hypothetical protein
VEEGSDAAEPNEDASSGLLMLARQSSAYAVVPALLGLTGDYDSATAELDLAAVFAERERQDGAVPRPATPLSPDSQSMIENAGAQRNTQQSTSSGIVRPTAKRPLHGAGR